MLEELSDRARELPELTAEQSALLDHTEQLYAVFGRYVERQRARRPSPSQQHRLQRLESANVNVCGRLLLYALGPQAQRTRAAVAGLRDVFGAAWLDMMYCIRYLPADPVISSSAALSRLTLAMLCRDAVELVYAQLRGSAALCEEVGLDLALVGQRLAQVARSAAPC